MDMRFKTQGLPADLQNASDLLARNNAPAAEQALRKMAQSGSADPIVFHLLGIAIVEQGRIDEGLEMIRRSLQMSPSDATLRTNLAAILHKLGRKDQALAEYHRALEMNPQLVVAYANLGQLLLDRREYVEAQRVLQRGVELAPAYLEMWNDLGISLLKQCKLDEAEAVFRRAIALNETYPTAHNNLGLVLHQRGDLPAAETEMRRCLAINPRYAKGYENLAWLLMESKRCDEAEKLMRQALMVIPNAYEIHQALGDVLHEMNRFEEALSELLIAHKLCPGSSQVLVILARVCDDMDRPQDAQVALGRALELDGNSPEVHSGIRYNHFLRGRIEESLAADDAALQRDPENAKLRMARAADLLMLGDMERGWEAYEWRHKFKNNVRIPHRGFSAPRWEGSHPGGRTILVHWEQGYGDAIQFCRYVPLVAQMGARVIVEAQRPLVRLFRSLENVQQVLAHGEALPPFDLSCSMMSMPYVLKTKPGNIPDRVPYLRAAPEDVASWQARLGTHYRLRVALVWSGLGSHGLNRLRSMKLQTLAPILAVPGVEFFSLQMGGAEEIAQVAPGKITDVTPHIHDFADTAAALTQMDLVISVDTAAVHLAGALGIPVWMMLYFPGEWRWMLERGDSPWYPSMRIFRQGADLAWAPVAEAVAAALRLRACAR